MNAKLKKSVVAALAAAGTLGVVAVVSAQSFGPGIGRGMGGGMGRGMGGMGSWTVSQGDPVAGKAVAEQVCVACHSIDGNSAQAEFPRIAGQKKSYLYAQLRDFASGARKNEIMAGMVANLDEKAMQNAAAYYSRQTSQPVAANSDPALLASGKVLFDQGDWNRQIPACANCHVAGQDFGRRLAFPLLEGQHSAYIEAQLKALREGARGNAMMMPMNASRLSAADIKSVAAYISTR